MSSRGLLFNCIIVNEVLMQLQERDLPSVFSHESHVSAQSVFMETQNTHCTLVPLLSNTLTVNLLCAD